MAAPTPPSYTPGDSYPVLPEPNFTDPLHTYGNLFGDTFHAPAVLELLFSTDGWRQRGVMLAGGQGIIPTGTVLGQVTQAGATQYTYKPYNHSNSDGSQVPLGFLRNGVDTGGPSGTPSNPQMALMVDRGVVNYQVVSGLDSGAITKLVGRVDAAVGSFTF